jgi:hypothetical protein
MTRWEVCRSRLPEPFRNRRPQVPPGRSRFQLSVNGFLTATVPGRRFRASDCQNLSLVQGPSRIDIEKSAYHQQSQNESWVEARIARQRRKAHEALRPVRSRVRVIASNRESLLKTASNRLGP